MIKTTYICDHCYKQIEKEQICQAVLNIKDYKDECILKQRLEFCEECAYELAKEIMKFIQPKKGI